MSTQLPFVLVQEHFHRIVNENMPEPQKVKRLETLLRTHLEKEDASELLDTLGDTFQKNPMSHDFHYRLTRGSRKHLLDIVRRIERTGRAGTAPLPSAGYEHIGGPAPKAPKVLRRLVDEDNGGLDRMVAMDDPDILDRYIDYNIKNVTSDVDPQANDRYIMIVHYENKKTLSFMMGNIPVTFKYPKGIHHVRINRRPYGGSTANYFIRRGGFIYPVDAQGNVLINTSDTPNLVNFRSSIEHYMRAGNQLVEIAQLVNTFGGIIKMSANHLSGTRPLIINWGRTSLPNYTVKNGQFTRTPAPVGAAFRGQSVPRSPMTYQDSLKSVQSYLSDSKAFQNGRPVFKTIVDFDRYWRNRGFSLVKNDQFGPTKGRQLIYIGDKNVVVKVKTAGYRDGPRMGKATMSLEINDGGQDWENAVAKVNAKGNFIAKNMHVGGEIVRLPADHPGRAKGLEHGIRYPGSDKIQPLTKFEVIQGGQGPVPNKQAWADSGHLDLPDTFNPAGAENLSPDPWR